jgi:hypothetical protein
MPVSYDFLWSELGIDSGANLELRLLNKLLCPCRFSYLCWNLTLKTRMDGPKIASFCSGVSICGSMGSHPEGPSRSDGISLMLSRLRRFDSRHSRF